MHNAIHIQKLNSLRVTLQSIIVTGLFMTSAQFAQAEGQSNLGVPIIWGDCIPVPVNAAPMGMGALAPFVGTAPMPTPFPSMPAPFPAAPPSPFYGGNMPAPLPLPPQPFMDSPQCFDENKEQLSNLQVKYDQEITASRKKIEELKQILNETQNQLQDSVVSLESITKKQSADQTNVDGLKKTLEELKQTSEGMISIKEKENQTLKQKLVKLDAAGGSIQKELQKLQKENQSLQSQLVIVNETSGKQAKKLMAFGNTTSNLTILKQQLSGMSKSQDSMQQAYQAQTAESAMLKKKLAELKKANQVLQARIGELKTNEASKNKEYLVLKESSSKFGLLKNTQQKLTVENEDLKKKLSELSKASESKESEQKHVAENEALKKQFSELSKDYKSLQDEANTLKAEAEGKKKKILGLVQSANQLALLQQSLNTQQEETVHLKQQLASSSDIKTELDSCKTNLDESTKKLSTQDQKVSSLEASSEESAKLNKSQQEELEQLNQQLSSCANTKTELDSCKTNLDESAKKLATQDEKLAKATADTDKDGVLDSVDKCPETSKGTQVDSLGCLADADKDGVADASDECPNSPVDSKVTDKGCPEIADADKDGVADESDLCPSSKEGSSVNEFGCLPTQNITLEGVTFKLGSARLKSESLPILDAAAKTLQANPDLKIEVGGHTDNQGFTGVNKRLSQRRANTVMIYLIRQGIPAEKLTAKGYGEKQPVTVNDTDAGREKNRRVELKILK